WRSSRVSKRATKWRSKIRRSTRRRKTRTTTNVRRTAYGEKTRLTPNAIRQPRCAMSALPEYNDYEPDTAKALIQLEGVTKIYDSGENEVQALRGVDVAIQRGEFVAVVGPPRSGKSTLMRILGCLDTPPSGEYGLDGDDLPRLT